MGVEKIFRHPWAVVGVFAVITVFFAFQLPKARMDNNIMSFLPADIPARVIAKHFEEEYNDSIVIMVGLERPYGTVFDSAFLSRIREFGGTVELIDLVKDVTSIMSTQYISSDSESIMVTDLVGDDFSGTSEEIAELKRRIDSWDMYRGSLVSGDFSSTQIVISLNATSDHAGDPEVMGTLIKIRELAKEMFRDFAAVYTAGQSVVSATLTESAFADLVFLIPLVVVVVLAVLVLSFRHFTYVTLPLLTVIIAALWSVGAMPLFGVKLTLLSIVLPVILVAVGSAYAIHIISHYRDEIQNKTLTAEEHRAFVLGLAAKMLKPVFLAALTTFAGFISFCFAPLNSMREFGIFASFGVLVAFLAALTLVPAMLLIRGPRAVKLAANKKPAKKKTMFNPDDKLAGAMIAVTNRKGTILAFTALVIAVSISGALKLHVDNAMIEFFSAGSEVNRSDRFIREHFGGSTQLIVSVEADRTEILLSPEVLGALDGLSAYLTERVPCVGKVTGFTDTVKRVNQMFHVGEPPEGIRAGGQRAADSSGAGEFGFGDFGFEDYEEQVELPVSGPADAGLPALPFGETPSGEAAAPARPPASAETPVTFAMINSAIGKHADMSASELTRELKRLTNYEGYAYYEIPTDPARYGKQTSGELGQLVANYLVLLAGNTDSVFSNDPLEPTAIETIILVNSQWQEDVQRITKAIDDYVEAKFPKNVKVLVGGGAMQEGALSSLVVNSQVLSVIAAVLTVLLIVSFSNKSLAAGLIAALPLSIAITCNFAVMGFLGITLNMATAMIASLAVGIGIDYTIHFMEAFKREYKAGGDYLRRTFATSGKAILINAVSVGAGFGVLVFSRFRVVAQFGVLVALSMAVSAAVSLTVIPVLLATVKPAFIYGQSGASR
ncbi:MAG: MMPL family transporter [Treponema sp.]|jgi:predicted RND superfamily exporter protein|nr:MMPL family transporter [Treponema sp.]